MCAPIAPALEVPVAVTVPSAAAAVTMQPGDRVSLHGLSRDEFNGRIGEIKSFDSAKGRYAVQIARGGMPILLRPENLKLEVEVGPAETVHPGHQVDAGSSTPANDIETRSPSASTMPKMKQQQKQIRRARREKVNVRGTPKFGDDCADDADLSKLCDAIQGLEAVPTTELTEEQQEAQQKADQIKAISSQREHVCDDGCSHMLDGMYNSMLRAEVARLKAELSNAQAQLAVR